MKTIKPTNKTGILRELTKFRLSFMVSLSAVAGYWLAPGALSPSVWGVLAGVFLLAGGSSGINQFQERKLDALMSRTSKRPIPSKKIKPSYAFFISVFLIVSGFFILSGISIYSALLGIANVFFYNLLYTPLKTKSALSILPGAIVGAIPPMIGWVAAGGNLFDPQIIFIATFMFLWQMPHFWLLLITFGIEYEKAGFSSISKFLNMNQVKMLVFIWTVITSLFLFSFPLFRITMSPLMTGALSILNTAFIITFYRLIFKLSYKSGFRGAFIAINTFMMLVLILFILNLLT